MRPIRESVRIHIRRLYFTSQLSMEAICERLGMSHKTVRDALVLDGGKATTPTHGPYHKEQRS